MEIGNIVPGPLFPYPSSQLQLWKKFRMLKLKMCQQHCTKEEGKACFFYCNDYGLFFAYFIFVQDWV